MSQPINHFRLNVGFILNLPVGESREFVFIVAQTRFEPDLELESVSGTAQVTKTAQGLLVHVLLNAQAGTDCVRCLEKTRVALSSDFTELYAFSRDSITDSGLLLPEDAHINLSPLIREYMLLSIPISPLCKPDCKGLCPQCGENLNETSCNHDEDIGDARFEVLKDFFKKNI